jgi:uncharacterized protein with ATP-grasp and redox domains
MLRRTLFAAREVADDPWLHRKVLNEAMTNLARADFDRSPAEIVADVTRLAARALGNPDPLAKAKAAHRLEARALEEGLQQQIEDADSPLAHALWLAAAANAVDAAVFGPVSLGSEFAALTIDEHLVVDDRESLIKDLETAKRVLYVCDNVGELIVDKLLIERIHTPDREVTCVVSRSPILNDATLADAEAIGLSEICSVVDAGPTETAGIGLVLPLASSDVQSAFESADMVIAKGSAAYQTLAGEKKPVYFLLRAKCSVVAERLGVDPGDVVIQGS